MRFVQFILLILLFSGCLNQPDCTPTNTNEVKIAFNKSEKVIREITFDEITVSGLNKKFYVNSKVSSVILPVNSEIPETTITFKFEGRTETMKLSYNMVSRVISKDCGAFLYQENLKVDDSTLKAFEIVNDKLLTNAKVNINVFIL